MGRGRKQNPYYDIERLLEIGRDRGFENRKELWYYLMARLNYHKGIRQFSMKMSSGQITRAQTKIFADALEMTPQELIEVFYPETFITVGRRTFAHLSDEDRKAFQWGLEKWEKYRNAGKTTPTPKKKAKAFLAEKESDAMDEINSVLADTDD